MMLDLLEVINYDIKIIQKRITLVAYFHSKQVFPPPKQTKGVNIEDAQSTKLFLKNHGNKHDPSVIFYNIEQVHTTAKPEVKGDCQYLCCDKKYKQCNRNRSKSTTDRMK